MPPARFALILAAVLVVGAASVAGIALLPVGARPWLLAILLLAALALRVAARIRRTP